MTDEYEKLRLVQTRGPTIQAQAKMLASQEFTSQGRTQMHMVLEIYETAGGALIAVSRGTPIDFDGFEDVRALVVEPQEDVQAMHFAVMEHFDYEDRARTMARKLKWKLTRIVA